MEHMIERVSYVHDLIYHFETYKIRNLLNIYKVSHGYVRHISTYIRPTEKLNYIIYPEKTMIKSKIRN